MGPRDEFSNYKLARALSENFIALYATRYIVLLVNVNPYLYKVLMQKKWKRARQALAGPSLPSPSSLTSPP